MQLAFAIAAAAVLTVLGTGAAATREYPFCRNTGGGPGDCRYDTLEQCQAAVSGVGGYCQQNFFLPPAAGVRVPHAPVRTR